jgi:hypothetical protein
VTAHIIYLSLRRIAGVGSSRHPGWDDIVGGSSARLAALDAAW